MVVTKGTTSFSGEIMSVIAQSLPFIVTAKTASKHLRRCGCTAFGSLVCERIEISSSFERK